MVVHFDFGRQGPKLDLELLQLKVIERTLEVGNGMGWTFPKMMGLNEP